MQRGQRWWPKVKPLTNALQLEPSLRQHFAQMQSKKKAERRKPEQRGTNQNGTRQFLSRGGRSAPVPVHCRREQLRMKAEVVCSNGKTRGSVLHDSARKKKLATSGFGQESICY
jgi:hypothetical protein